MSDDRPRYTTLRDYLSLLRRQRLVIVFVSLVFAGAGLGVSLAQSPTYVSDASIAYRDVSQDLPLFGGSALPQQTPAERAARNAQLISTDKIAEAAKDELDTDVSANSLSAAVTARVAVQTNLVTVEARWGSAEFAADIANAFADVAADQANKDEEKRLKRAIKGLESGVDGDSSDSTAEQFAEATISQLRAVKETSSAAEITTPAEVPSGPVSPRPVRNAILGLLVGIAFGLVTAFARDSLDRKLRDPREIHDEMGLPVLGRVGVTAMGSTGGASSNGRLPTPRDRESFRMLRANLASLNTEAPVRSVVVTSGLPEEGKSTVAAALAAASAAAGQSTLLVDCDLRRPVLAERLGLSRQPGLAEYLAGKATPAEILQVKELPNPETPRPRQSKKAKATGELDVPTEGKRDSFVCIASGAPPAQPTELFASDRCRDFIEKASNAYDFVIFDTSPMLAAADPLELIPLVDGVLICVRIARSTKEETVAVQNALSLLPDRPVGVVATGLRPDDGSYSYYGYEYA